MSMTTDAQRTLQAFRFNCHCRIFTGLMALVEVAVRLIGHAVGGPAQVHHVL